MYLSKDPVRKIPVNAVHSLCLVVILIMGLLLAGCGTTQLSGKQKSVNGVPSKQGTPVDQTAFEGSRPPAVKPETIGLVNTLPEIYPPHWIIVHDFAGLHWSDGKMIVLDADATTQPTQYKGMFNIAFLGQFVQATTRPEMYVAETFYSRGQRGERTDVITIYEKSTLLPVGEIKLPGGKRSVTMPQRNALQLIGDERFLLVFNLTPATSVTVVDIVKREVVGEVATPGCSLIYPTGPRGFSSLCSNGGMLSVQLDQNGQVARQQRVAPFFDVEEHPIFEKSAVVGGINYFPTYKGEMQPVDLSGDIPIIGERWSLLTEDDLADGWRPGGWQLIGADSAGRLYLLMHSNGHNGTHKNGGSEIWVFNPVQKARIGRIKLENWGTSLALTHGDDPLLVVTNKDMQLDVYKAHSGEFLRTMEPFGQETPFQVYGSR